MRRVGQVLFILATALTVGCARRGARVALPDMAIPVSCASEIRLVGCDARVSPPKCKSVRVKYRSGCEEILVGRK
jgi:hypothetical protein